MFEFFTDRARRAVALSQDEAIALGHDFIGTEHILLGLLAAGEGRGLEVLAALEVEPAGLRQAVLTRVARETS
ncbi:Clp protease N-terminal domain-containing protein [Streptomyces sp. NPDC003300]|uniref:Clp protease N-terminal domain-containing protein n=1 Tax=unclassified Streptomyces TaxID=2593676 RepID=UPI0033ABEFBB